MTKKDFEAIAGAVRDARMALVVPGHPLPNQTTQIFDSMARSLADVIAKTNAKFQRPRFLTACGVDVVNQPLHRKK